MWSGALSDFKSVCYIGTAPDAHDSMPCVKEEGGCVLCFNSSIL